ncbi:MAG: hypothetical protein EXS02_13655 [Planctomycetes bacterium]|nr:hypothetical protein [Planctomycetota bacterium]
MAGTSCGCESTLAHPCWCADVNSIYATLTADLLAGLCKAVQGTGACTASAEGVIEAEFGELAGLRGLAAGDLRELEIARRCGFALPLPRGGVVAASIPVALAPQWMTFIESLLRAMAQREQLECDMDSMNHSSLQLLEQVSQLGDTLPRLSACETIAEVAAGVLEACVVAASVERGVYLHLHPQSGACEAMVYVENTGHGRAVQRTWPINPFVDAELGIVALALSSTDRSVVRSTKQGVALGSPESLAQNEVLGVQVGYDAGGRRICTGAVLLFDKMRTSYDLDEHLEHLGSEEGSVAASFASMLGAVLGARQTAELGKEMRMAQTIQGQILPARPAIVPGFELAGACRTSGAVGGDYFDYVPMADGRMFAVVADVSGHNLASGMVMVAARAALRTLASVANNGAQVFDQLAAGMHDDLMRTERFITAAGIVLRPSSHSVEVVNAGHNEVLHFRARGKTVSALSGSGPILGFLPRPEYTALHVQLEPGDCLLLYTDGVTEAADASGEMFGEARLAGIVEQTAKFGAAAVVDAVLAAVRNYEGQQGHGDDVTVLAIRSVPFQAGSQ